MKGVSLPAVDAARKEVTPSQQRSAADTGSLQPSKKRSSHCSANALAARAEATFEAASLLL